MNLTRINEKAWDALAKDIRSDILSGRLRTGEAIRTEVQLANNYNISRNSVRKAIDALVAQGLLKRIQGSGTYVAPVQEQMLDSPISRRQILFLSMETELSDYCAHNTFVPIFDRISSLLAEKGFNILYSSVDLDYKPPVSLLNHDVCGVIFHGRMPVEFWEKYIKPLPSVGLQYDTPEIDCNWVKIDNFSRSFKAVQYLHSLGHTRIGYVSNESEMQLSSERFDGYLRSMSMFNLEVNPRWIINWQRPRVNGLLLSEKLNIDYWEYLKKAFEVKSEQPTAFVCADNYRANSTEYTLNKVGLNVPEDISLVGGFNLNNENNLRYTAIDDRLEELCREALNLLLGDIDETNQVKDKTIVIKPQLFIGKTTIPINKSSSKRRAR
ncbi:MAG: substrate-binding domain-containing protein [Victivallales bacterium]|nr:substrate-binding domain-containing protein [Victivallales bacterium]